MGQAMRSAKWLPNFSKSFCVEMAILWYWSFDRSSHSYHFLPTSPSFTLLAFSLEKTWSPLSWWSINDTLIPVGNCKTFTGSSLPGVKVSMVSMTISIWSTSSAAHNFYVSLQRLQRSLLTPLNSFELGLYGVHSMSRRRGDRPVSNQRRQISPIAKFIPVFTFLQRHQSHPTSQAWAVPWTLTNSVQCGCYRQELVKGPWRHD